MLDRVIKVSMSLFINLNFIYIFVQSLSFCLFSKKHIESPSDKWQLMLLKMWSKKNSHPLLLGVQASTATTEIIVAVPQEDENQSPSRSSYINPGQIPKGCFIRIKNFSCRPHEPLVSHVNCCSIYNIQKLQII